MNTSPHIPIMLDDVIAYLDIQPADKIIEGTTGFAGHSQHLIKPLSKDGLFIGIDRDPDAVKFSKDILKNSPNAFIYHNSAEHFDTLMQQHNVTQFTKFFLDLGVSSYQLDTPERGFSHRFDGPLDMRMDPSQGQNAADIVNTYSKQQLSDIFYYYGELAHNKKLVENIFHERNKTSIATTDALRNIIKRSYRFSHRPHLMKTCSKVFQALRIEVNQELSQLDTLLEKIETFAAPNAIIIILSFHSLEDKRIKRFVKQSETLYFDPKSVIKPSKEERAQNSRSRSTKCRVIKIITC